MNGCDLADPAAVLTRVADSLSVACDWVESGKPDDLANAIELTNYCIDDVQDLLSGASP